LYILLVYFFVFIIENARSKKQKKNCWANIYFNRQCIKQGIVPKYDRIKIPYTSSASKMTQKKVHITRMKENNPPTKTKLNISSQFQGQTYNLISSAKKHTYRNRKPIKQEVNQDHKA